MPLAERELIARIRRQARAGGSAGLGRVLRGMGDDCAVLGGSAREDLLVTTDFSIEGVHFRREWHPAEAAGHRALARGLSDIAAMGGEPAAVFLSLGLPSATPQEWVDGFLRGFLRLAWKHQVALAGGDTAQSPRAIVADVMVVGRVPRGQAILRSGARAGDAIYVTGAPGRSAATLARLRAGEPVNPRVSEHAPHFFPQPRLAVARFLRRRRLAGAMIDLSDGLSTDLAHICEESRVAATLWEDRLFQLAPRSSLNSGRGSSAPGSGAAVPLLARMLHGGEDYELLFTAPAQARIPGAIAGERVTRIGEIVARSRQLRAVMLLERSGRRRELAARGWEHFRARAG